MDNFRIYPLDNIYASAYIHNYRNAIETDRGFDSLPTGAVPGQGATESRSRFSLSEGDEMKTWPLPTGDHWIDQHTQHRSTSADPKADCLTCGHNVVRGNHARCPQCWAFLLPDVRHTCAR